MNNLLYIFLDHFFYWVRTLLRRKGNENNIIILSFKLLGDTVFTFPATEVIVNKFNKMNIYIFCFKESKDIYKISFPNVRCVTFNKSEIDLSDRIPNFQVIKNIRKINPSIVFDFTSGYWSAFILLCSGVKLTAGFNSRYFKGFYDHFTLKRLKPHLMDMFIDVVKLICPTESYINKEFAINYDKNARIFVHPGAGWKAKQWNLRKFIELAIELNKEYNTEFLIERNWLADDIINDMERKGIRVNQTDTIKGLVNEIMGSSVFISNDSGPLHIASALGKPTFSIYGPTNPKFSLPFGKNHQYLQKQLLCSPQPNLQYCFTYGGRNCPTYDCMNYLSVEEVKREVKLFLIELGMQKK